MPAERSTAGPERPDDARLSDERPRSTRWDNVFGAARHIAVHASSGARKEAGRLDALTDELAALRRSLAAHGASDDATAATSMADVEAEAERLRTAIQKQSERTDPEATVTTAAGERAAIEAAIAVAHRTIVRHAPQYEPLLRQVEHRFVPTLRGAVAVTDGRTIQYGSAFLRPARGVIAEAKGKGRQTAPRDDEAAAIAAAHVVSDQAYVVIHELLHVALEHPRRGAVAARRPRPYRHDIAGLCCDAIINQIIDEWQPRHLRPRPDRFTWNRLQRIATRLAERAGDDANQDLASRFWGPQPTTTWLSLHDAIMDLRAAALKRGRATRKRKMERLRDAAHANEGTSAAERQTELGVARTTRPEEFADDPEGANDTADDALAAAGLPARTTAGGSADSTVDEPLTEDEYVSRLVDRILEPEAVAIELTGTDVILPLPEDLEVLDAIATTGELSELLATMGERSRQAGHEPGTTLAGELRRLRARTDWAALVRPLLSEWLRPRTVPAPHRPSRRWIGQHAAGIQGFWEPGQRREPAGGRLGILIDTSASISNGDLSALLGHLEAMVSVFQSPISVWTGDTRVTGEWHDVQGKLATVQGIECAGRGGTEFQPLLQAAEAADCTAAVYLTDGMAGFGTAPEKMQVIWGLLPDTTDPENVPWGHAVVIEHGD